MRFHENNGHWPLMKAKETKPADGELKSLDSPVIAYASKDETTEVRNLAL